MLSLVAADRNELATRRRSEGLGVDGDRAADRLSRAHDPAVALDLLGVVDAKVAGELSVGSRMQEELLDRRRWKTRVELANAMFEYVEIFHNRQRRHSALGVLTPVEFEARYDRIPAA